MTPSCSNPLTASPRGAGRRLQHFPRPVARSRHAAYTCPAAQEEGYEVQIAAPSKKKLHGVVHDFEPG
jgi:hypothetical protein